LKFAEDLLLLTRNFVLYNHLLYVVAKLQRFFSKLWGICRKHLHHQSSSFNLKMGPMRCSGTSATKYQPPSLNIPKQRRPQLYRDGRPKSC